MKELFVRQRVFGEFSTTCSPVVTLKYCTTDSDTLLFLLSPSGPSLRSQRVGDRGDEGAGHQCHSPAAVLRQGERRETSGGPGAPLLPRRHRPPSTTKGRESPNRPRGRSRPPGSRTWAAGQEPPWRDIPRAEAAS